MTYTNATALSTVIELLADCGDQELLEKLVHMLAVAEKPKSKSTTPSKTQIQNGNTAKALACWMWENEVDGLTSRQIVDTCGIPEIATTQKAVAILKIAMQNGWVVRREVKSKIYWAAGEVDPR